jgi:pyridoxamine 5'-phosphate oxidase
MKVADLRAECKRETLDEAHVDGDPFRQFGRWFDAAVEAGMPQPNAMTLATVGGDLRPSARIVLLKELDSAGFVFFTNYASHKGQALGANPQAALLFHWVELERQVRIEGVVGKVDVAESDAYFEQRPRAARLAVRASPQSEAIAGRALLEARFAAVEEQYRDAGERVPRPPHWGGYRVIPSMLEFWQGRRSRMHDRIRYRRSPDTGAWIIDRLAP